MLKFQHIYHFLIINGAQQVILHISLTIIGSADHISAILLTACFYCTSRLFNMHTIIKTAFIDKSLSFQENNAKVPVSQYPSMQIPSCRVYQ